MAALNAKSVVAALQAKGYSPVQVVNSLERKLAWVEKVSKSPIERAVYKKAKAVALALATNAYVEAGPGGLPCSGACEWAVDEVCVCPCAGTNHGHLHKQQAIVPLAA